jgi:hypothetical protein
MGVRDIYRDRASLGHLPVLRGQTLIETPYRLQADADTIGLWWFDESRGTVLNDKAVTFHDGILVNTPTRVATGPWGQALAFNGSDQCISTEYSMGAQTTVTIEVIMKHATVVASGSIWTKPIVENGCYGYEGWLLALIGGSSAAAGDFGKPNFGVTASSSGLKQIIGANRIDDGVFHYMVGTVDITAGAAFLYVDGVSVGTVTGITGTMTPTYPVYFARSNVPAFDWGSPTIAICRVSTVVRSAAEILTNAKLMGFA